MSRDQIIEPSRLEEWTTYVLDYRYVDDPNAGFGFDCDKNGNPILPMNDAAAANYRECLEGAVGGLQVTFRGISTYQHRYRHPARLRCTCGEVVVLEHFTNTCDKCGADYNSSGQHLAPRSQWGEETGESLSDILRIP